MNTRGATTAAESAAGNDLTLGLLRAIEDDPRQSQRSLAARLGIAVGLTNAVLKRAAAKGLVKVGTAPARRYAYYLTPQGFAEKSRLTLQYLEHSLTVIRDAREAFAAEFMTCRCQGWTRVAILGGGEMADIALLGAQEADVHPVAVIATARAGQVRSGVSVVADIATARGLAMGGALDAIVLTEVVEESARDQTARTADIPPDRLLAPAFLCPHGRTARPERGHPDDGAGTAHP
jgi:DNA-binding MarR family transcriptional regulator